MSTVKREECPACGGSGGGPFGPPNSGWDIETYECPRCEGWGYLREAAVTADDVALPRPGIVRTTPTTPAEPAIRKGGRRAG